MSHPGKIFRAARAALGLNQKALGEGVHLHVRTIMRLEAEDPSVSLEAVDKVRKFFEGRGFEFLPEAPEKGLGLILPKSVQEPVERSRGATSEPRPRSTGKSGKPA